MDKNVLLVDRLQQPSLMLKILFFQKMHSYLDALNQNNQKTQTIVVFILRQDGTSFQTLPRISRKKGQNKDVDKMWTKMSH